MTTFRTPTIFTTAESSTASETSKDVSVRSDPICSRANTFLIIGIAVVALAFVIAIPDAIYVVLREFNCIKPATPNMIACLIMKKKGH